MAKAPQQKAPMPDIALGQVRAGQTPRPELTGMRGAFPGGQGVVPGAGGGQGIDPQLAQELLRRSGQPGGGYR